MTPADNWARCKPWIEAAIATGPGVETVDDVERHIASGAYQAWFGNECCAITEIADFNGQRILNVVHGGGDMVELLERLEPAMCEFAREQGCTKIMGQGRKGWARITEKRGYRFAWLVMCKDLLT